VADTVTTCVLSAGTLRQELSTVRSCAESGGKFQAGIAHVWQQLSGRLFHLCCVARTGAESSQGQETNKKDFGKRFHILIFILMEDKFTN